LRKLFLLNRKVAFSHYSSPNDISGVTTWLERFLIRLSHDGYDLAVLLHHFGPNVSQASILRALLDSGAEVEIRPRSLSLADDVRDTLTFLNRHQPSVFLPQCLSAMYLAAAIAGKQGLPWVMTVHSDDPEYWAILDTVRPENSGGTFVGVSDSISRLAVERGMALHPMTIPCGAPMPLRSATFSDAPFRVVFAGRIVEEQKRISLVITTMAEACRRDGRVQCLVVGGGPAQAAAVQLVDKWCLTDRIRFLGPLSPAETQAELAKCQVFLLMSDFEGLPLSLLEAMAAGVVPVARAIQSGVPELVQDGVTGLLVNEQPQNAANEILRLVDDPVLWAECSHGARKLVEDRFDEDSAYLKWVVLLDQLCESCRIHYPIITPANLRLQGLHPLITQRYPRPVSLGQRAGDKLRTIAGKAKRFISAM
jgi:glycosyltransferase involved in cell wall biosynthesis